MSISSVIEVFLAAYFLRKRIPFVIHAFNMGCCSICSLRIVGVNKVCVASPTEWFQCFTKLNELAIADGVACPQVDAMRTISLFLVYSCIRYQLSDVIDSVEQARYTVRFVFGLRGRCL